MSTPFIDPPFPSQPRAIRSFVVRAGRMSDAQTRAIETLMPRYGIPFSLGKVPPGTYGATHFGRAAPLIVEIGFGMGVTTAQIAQARPHENFLALEVHPPGVGNLLKLIEANGLSNVRVMQHDAVEVLRERLDEGSVEAFHIYFPDPWPKKRHHKRRLIQPDFVRLLASRLKTGGYLHLATDWEHYAHWMLAVLSSEPLLKNTAHDFAPKPEWRPTTKFETRGVNLGHGVWDLFFEKR